MACMASAFLQTAGVVKALVRREPETSRKQETQTLRGRMLTASPGNHGALLSCGTDQMHIFKELITGSQTGFRKTPRPGGGLLWSLNNGFIFLPLHIIKKGENLVVAATRSNQTQNDPDLLSRVQLSLEELMQEHLPLDSFSLGGPEFCSAVTVHLLKNAAVVVQQRGNTKPSLSVVFVHVEPLKPTNQFKA